MKSLSLLAATTIATAGLVFAPFPRAGSQEESTGTFREVEREWQALAGLAEPGVPVQDVKIAVNWPQGGLSAHWRRQRRAEGEDDPVQQFPAERVVKVLTQGERNRFLAGLKPDNALRSLTNSGSAAEVGASGAGIFAIAVIEISVGGQDVETLYLDLTGLRFRGGTGQGIYSGYLAEFLDELTVKHVGSPLPPSVMETVSGEAFAKASRSASRFEQYKIESGEKK